MMVKSIFLVIATILSIVLAAPTNVTGALTFPFMGHALEARSSSSLPCLDCAEVFEVVEKGKAQPGDLQVLNSLCVGHQYNEVSFALMCYFCKKDANEDKVRGHG